MERRVEVFFYGLFMDGDALRENGFHPANARQASVEDMALHLGERATLIPERGGRVHGMLMNLTHAELDRLYAEPSVEAYRPEPVIASLRDGTIVAALCFNLPAPFRPGFGLILNTRPSCESPQSGWAFLTPMSQLSARLQSAALACPSTDYR